MIASDCLDGVPLLMLANKQDLEVTTIFTHWGNGIEKTLNALPFINLDITVFDIFQAYLLDYLKYRAGVGRLGSTCISND